jgi:hypothetical protein
VEQKLQQNTRIKEFLVKNYKNEISLLHLIDITNEELIKFLKIRQ